MVNPVDANHIQTIQNIEISEYVLDQALLIADPPSDAILVSVEEIWEQHWQKNIWKVCWITPEHDSIEIDLDSDTLEVIYYLDSSKTRGDQDTDLTETKIEQLWKTTSEFLEMISIDNSNPIPIDAEFVGITEDSQGWDLNWVHRVDGFPVYEDFIRVSCDWSGTQVCTYAKCWHEFNVDLNVVTNRESAINITCEYLHNQDVVLIDCVQTIIGSDTDMQIYTPRLTWCVKQSTPQGGYFINWVDTITGQILLSDTTLDIYEDVFVQDEGTQATYDCAESIYRRLDSATDWYPRYYEDPTISSVLGKLEYERVFYFLGHGTGEYVSSDLYTTLIVDDDAILPTDVDGEDLSGMDLAFLCACYSAADYYYPWWPFEWWPESVDTNICEGFIDGGAECVFGWSKPVLKTQAMIFSRYFFDYAVNSYDFQACYDYAYSKVDSGTKSIAQIYGDTDLYLDEYDYGGDNMPGPNLGSGYDKYFYVLEEGLWNPDDDWFYFTVTGTRQVNIWATPIESEFDIKFMVYDGDLHCVSNCDSNGAGSEEHDNFSGSGTYIIHIMRENTHGGSYDLTIHISS
ncbi:MAG: hypothetical protein ACTSSE_16885 [Candidatus Thorarchaeota archaeon]